MRHTGLALDGLGSLRCRQQSPVLSALPHRAPRSHPSRMDNPRPPPTVSSCSDNNLGVEGVTALSSGPTALTNVQSINFRWGQGRRKYVFAVLLLHSRDNENVGFSGTAG
jgi:hypothetical protein